MRDEAQRPGVCCGGWCKLGHCYLWRHFLYILHFARISFVNSKRWRLIVRGEPGRVVWL